MSSLGYESEGGPVVWVVYVVGEMLAETREWAWREGLTR